MKIIKDISETIENELKTAEDYLVKAVHYSQDQPDSSKLYYNKSLRRMEDVEDFHRQVVSLIEDYRSKNGEPPAPMMYVYNYLHERAIKMAGEIKRLQELYKNGL